ncbi:MAG TPA: hypothetical protein VGK60_06850 [Pedococcus sp.]
MAGSDVRTRVVLLGSQAVLLGLAMAFLVVPASALFLHAFGADRLAWVYLGVAASGVGASWSISRVQRRWSLARLGGTMLAVYAALVCACWALVAFADATVATAVLLVLFPLSIPLGFVVIGAQAGRLLDVRELKAHFPRVAAGFSVGFAVGGLAAAALVTPFGGPVHLLAVDVGAALAFLGLVAHTGRRYAGQLRTVPEPAPPRAAAAPRRSPRAALGSVIRNPLVLMVFGYQFLSAAVTQLLDWTVLNRAAVHYPDPSDLARFQGIYGAVINVTSVLFVLGLAGWLLTRHGIRLGLAANPVGVLVMLAASLATGWDAGAASTAFFLMVCAQQVVDLTLTDGMTRTSVNATYQALDARERFTAQARVEAAGVPLALGFVGVVLLVWPRLGLGVVALLVLALLLSVAWLALALLGYREYGRNLRRVLGSRAWDPLALRVDDPASQTVLAQLLGSADPGDVRLGLDVVAEARPQDLPARLESLLCSGDPALRQQALAVLAAQGVDAAASTSARLRSTVLAMVHEPTTPTEVRVLAARVARGWPEAAADLAGLGRSADPHLHAGSVVAAVHHALRDRSLGEGLAAEVQEFARGLALGGTSREALLEAVAAAPHPALAQVLAGAGGPLDSWLDDALRAHARWLLPHARHLLDDRDRVPDPPGLAVLRALGASGEPGCSEALVPHLDDPRRDVADAVRTGLLASGRAVATHQVPLVVARLLHCCERATVARRTRASLGGFGARGTLLGHALLDEVGVARSTAAELVGLLPHGGVPRRVLDDLADEDRGRRALALETVEVSLGRDLALRLAELFTPNADEVGADLPAARTATTAGSTTYTDGGDGRVILGDTVRALVLDADHAWDQPWLRACALHLAAEVCPDARGLAALLVADQDPVVGETARWVLAHAPA